MWCLRCGYVVFLSVCHNNLFPLEQFELLEAYQADSVFVVSAVGTPACAVSVGVCVPLCGSNPVYIFSELPIHIIIPIHLLALTPRTTKWA